MGETNKEKSFFSRLLQNTANKKADNEKKSQEVQTGEIIDKSLGDVNQPAPETSGDRNESDRMKCRFNYLHALFMKWSLADAKREVPAFYSDFMLNGQEPEPLHKTFLDEIQPVAQAALETLEMEGEKRPVNAQICIKVSEDEMSACIFLLPPTNGGKDVTEDLMLEALDECRVIFGIDERLVNRIARDKTYLKLFVAARGQGPVDGEDGAVKDCYERIERQDFDDLESADGKIDYEKINWLHPIKAGDVICHIRMPKYGEEGMTVRGIVLTGKVLSPFEIPSGSNTELNENATALVSKIDGTLFFEEGKFEVKNVFNILRDVDGSVGNIDAIGNLDIRGDIFNGFTVKATGNISIRGMIGNSTVIAGKNVQVGMGIRGNGNCHIKAGGRIDCVYMENCTVRARGSISSGSIINCDAVSDEEIESDNIVGGTVVAMKRIKAKTVGNQQRRQTVIYLGVTQEVLQERIELDDRIRELNGSIKQLVKDVRFLKSKQGSDLKREVLYRQMVKEKAEQEEELAACRERLETLNSAINEVNQCELTANRIYPPVRVMIRSDSLVIDREQAMCRVWSDEGEIRMS